MEIEYEENKKSLRALVDKVLGPDKADHWLFEPNLSLNGKSPNEVIQTRQGRVELVKILNAIQYGGVC